MPRNRRAASADAAALMVTHNNAGVASSVENGVGRAAAPARFFVFPGVLFDSQVQNLASRYFSSLNIA